MIDPLPELLHEADFRAGGSIGMPEPITNPATKHQYLVRSLIEEAFTSSQLEGAATTRERAKEMIRKNQPPRDRGERMVLNNYRTMEFVLGLRDEPLTPALVCEIQRQITVDTLEKPGTAGRFREPGERVVVAAWHVVRCRRDCGHRDGQHGGFDGGVGGTCRGGVRCMLCARARATLERVVGRHGGERAVLRYRWGDCRLWSRQR